MGDNGKIYLTRERLVELEKELRELKIVGRADIAQKIAEARGHGDLSENAEYEAAKEAQEHLEMRISKVEEMLSRTQIIDSSELPNDKVYILSVVTLEDQKTKEIVEYRLVSAEEANFEKNKIAVSSPLGRSLMGKKVGETAELKTPAGSIRYKILDIKR